MKRSELEKLIDEVISESMKGYKKVNEEEGDASPSDAFISAIQSNCSDQLSTLSTNEDKILAIAKLGNVFGFSPYVLYEIFERIAEGDESEEEESSEEME